MFLLYYIIIKPIILGIWASVFYSRENKQISTFNIKATMYKI